MVDERGGGYSPGAGRDPGRDAEQVERKFGEMVLALKARTIDIEAVGIGAGFVDEKRSRSTSRRTSAGRTNHCGMAVESVAGLPVVVENDANAAAWGRTGSARARTATMS